MYPTILSPQRWVLARACLTLALLGLLVGSVGMVLYLLSLGRSRSLAPESVIGVVILWPLLIILVDVFAGLGLLAARYRRAIWVLIDASALVVIVPLFIALDGANRLGSRIPNTITVVTQETGSPPATHTIIQGGPTLTNAAYIPFTSGAVVAIVALFVGINGAALYGGWWVVWYRGRDRRAGRETRGPRR